MIEFFTVPWFVRLSITLILGVNVLAQTLALVLNHYRFNQSLNRITENLLEASVLSHILVLALMFGQILNGYKNGFVSHSGYEVIRVLCFIIILIIVVMVYVVDRKFEPLIVLVASLVSLPFIETMASHMYPYLFVTVLFLYLLRSIWICIWNIRSISSNISELSVSRAINTLHTGVLFSESNGFTVLSNFKMRDLMLAISGKIFHNSNEFYDLLISGNNERFNKNPEQKNQLVYLLADGSAWLFTKTEIILRKKKYNHIAAVNISEQWDLNSKLKLQNEELKKKSIELKETIENLQILSKEKEIENAKIRSHDILGQRLTLMLRMILNENALDYNLLSSLSKGLIDELKSDIKLKNAQAELENIQLIFSTIGVDIKFEGMLPENNENSRLIIDVIREACTNAVRHGFATEIKIQSEQIDNFFNLNISNIGYTKNEAITLGSGLKAISKKIESIGGQININHHPIFTLSVILPGGNQYE